MDRLPYRYSYRSLYRSVPCKSDSVYFEHLMRSMLESQAAMMAAMTQMQQALLSRTIPNSLETGGEARHQAVKPEEAGSKPDQPATTSTEA